MPSFKETALSITREARLEPIKVLVWGPGDPGPTAPPEIKKAYQKRIQIKDELKKAFPRAEVFFSEDPEMLEISKTFRGHLRKEAFQAKIADLVLMLDISRGADLELDYFVPKYSWFRDKVYVFLPERYVPPKGLVKEVFDYLLPYQVEGFTDHEFEHCSLATEKAVAIAEGIALAMKIDF